MTAVVSALADNCHSSGQQPEVGQALLRHAQRGSRPQLNRLGCI